jgi:hypothetical protein
MGRAQDLVLVIRKARDEAKALLTQLEKAGHPQTNQSSSLYLALVSMQKRLTVDPPPPSVAQFGPELEQLAALCSGKLASIKPLLEEALRIAR